MITDKQKNQFGMRYISPVEHRRAVRKIYKCCIFRELEFQRFAEIPKRFLHCCRMFIKKLSNFDELFRQSIFWLTNYYSSESYVHADGVVRVELIRDRGVVNARHALPDPGLH